MSTHGDGGKGSGRRKEDASKVRDNWDLIFKKKDKPMEDYEDDEVICTICGTEMSPTEHGRWLQCDVCGNTRDFDEDDSNYDND
jgi:uncharacterized CHY-type Zn-finger protein